MEECRGAGILGLGLGWHLACPACSELGPVPVFAKGVQHSGERGEDVVGAESGGGWMHECERERRENGGWGWWGAETGYSTPTTYP